MSESASTESRRGSFSVSWMFWIPILMLVVYPLSTGPVVRLCEAIVGPYSGNSAIWNTLEVLYAPIIYLTGKFEPVGKFFEWYLGVWGL